MTAASDAICFVTAAPMTVQAFIAPHARAAARKWPVTIVSNTDDPYLLESLEIPARLHSIAVERQVSPWRDLAALLALWRFFSGNGFALVHSVGPKAGLLAMLAARAARVPLRVHTFTGQVWATRSGFVRFGLKAIDRLLAASATHLLADSESQRQFLVDQGVVRADKIRVLGSGSIAGVDASRFRPDPDWRTAVRSEMGIPQDALVFMYAGRMHREKGLLELLEAFRRIALERPDVWLALVGPDETGMLESHLSQLEASAWHRVRWVNVFSPSPERYLAAADVFVLPSHREGFGTSALEAASSGLPSIGTRIYGLTDAIKEGETGLLVPPQDPTALAGAMRSLAADASLRQRLGRAGCERARRDFSQQRVTAELMEFYAKIL